MDIVQKSPTLIYACNCKYSALIGCHRSRCMTSPVSIRVLASNRGNELHLRLRLSDIDVVCLRGSTEPNTYASHVRATWKQESRDVAKMTARCADKS